MFPNLAIWSTLAPSGGNLQSHNNNEDNDTANNNLNNNTNNNPNTTNNNKNHPNTTNTHPKDDNRNDQPAKDRLLPVIGAPPTTASSKIQRVHGAEPPWSTNLPDP